MIKFSEDVAYRSGLLVWRFYRDGPAKETRDRKLSGPIPIPRKKPNVPAGEIFEGEFNDSTVFPGTRRHYWFTSRSNTPPTNQPR